VGGCAGERAGASGAVVVVAAGGDDTVTVDGDSKLIATMRRLLGDTSQ
jgi:hypothetical protein